MFDEDSWHLVEDDLYTAQLLAISPDFRRMDEVLEGLMWALGQDPRQFIHIRGNLWLAKTDPFPGAPALRVWYQIEPGRVVRLRSIERIPEDS